MLAPIAALTALALVQPSLPPTQDGTTTEDDSQAWSDYDEARALFAEGHAAFQNGEYTRALHMLGQSLALARQVGDNEAEAALRWNIAYAHFLAAQTLDHKSAREHLEAAEGILQEQLDSPFSTAEQRQDAKSLLEEVVQQLGSRESAAVTAKPRKAAKTQRTYAAIDPAMLTPPPPPPPPGGRRETRDDRTDRRVHPATPWTLIGLGASAVITGSIMAVVGRGYEDKAIANVEDAVLANPALAREVRAQGDPYIRDAARTGDGLLWGGVGLAVVGVASATVGAVLVPKRRVRATASGGPRGFMLGMEGRF